MELSSVRASVRASLLATILVVWGLCAPEPAAAQSGAWQLRLRSVPRGSITIDGDLGEWRGIPGTKLGSSARIVSGGDWRGPDDAQATFSLVDDGSNLIVGVHARDDRFVRTPRYGSGEDQVVVWLAFARGGEIELRLLPGAPGIPARLRRGGRDVPAAAAVEMARDGGWSAEFAVPWAALPESRSGRTGMRAAVGLQDCDSEAHLTAQTLLATARVSGAPSSIPPLRIAVDEGVLNAFRRDRDLAGVTPSFQRQADVAGDPALEHLLVVEQYLMAYGPGIRGGQGYAYRTLPVRAPRDVLSLAVRDLTGDRRAEVVVRYRQSSPGSAAPDAGDRELLAVYRFTGDAFEPLLLVEAGKRLGQRSITNEVRMAADGTIEQRDARAVGFDAASWSEAPATDAQPILLPWGPIAARRLRWDGQRFAVANEERNPAPASPRNRTATRATSPIPQTAPARAPTDPHAAFLAEHGLSGARARFDLRADVAEDARPERVVAVDRFLVITGPGFSGGIHFYFQELPVVSAADVLAISSQDVTGDGKADLVVTTRQIAQEVNREILTVYRFTGGRLERLFAQEIARAGGPGQRVDCTVRFVGRGRAAREIEVRVGRARGWTAETWRFGGEPVPPEPLLLPWRGPQTRRFVLGPSGFQPR